MKWKNAKTLPNYGQNMAQTWPPLIKVYCKIIPALIVNEFFKQVNYILSRSSQIINLINLNPNPPNPNPNLRQLIFLTLLSKDQSQSQKPWPKPKTNDTSRTQDHNQINIKMPNTSLEPPASSKTPNQDLKDMNVLCTFKIIIESQNMEHGCIKDL